MMQCTPLQINTDAVYPAFYGILQDIIQRSRTEPKIHKSKLSTSNVTAVIKAREARA